MGQRKTKGSCQAILAIFCLVILSAIFFWVILPAILQAGATFTRTNGVREISLVTYTDGYGKWKNFDTALAIPAAPGELHISKDIDPEGEYNVPEADWHWAIQAPVQNIDADNATRDANAADLDLWLAVAEVASLPRQIERDEENMVRRPPASLEENLAAGALQHLPTVISAHEIDAIDARDSEASSSGFETDEAYIVRRPTQVPELDVVHGVDDERLLALVSGVGLIPEIAAMDLGLSAGVPQNLSNLPALPQPWMPEIDAVDVARDAEAELLAFDHTVGFRQQIERDDANMDRRLLMLSSVAPSLVDDVAAGAPQHLPTTLPTPEIDAVGAPVPEVDAVQALTPGIDAVDASMLEMDAVDAPAPEIVAVDAPMLEMDAIDVPAPEIVAVDASVPELDAIEAPILEIDAVDAHVLEMDTVDAPTSEIIAVDAPAPEITTVDAPVPEIVAVGAPVIDITADDAPVPEIVAGDAPAAGTNAIDPLNLPPHIARDDADIVRRLAEVPVIDVVEDEAGFTLLREVASDGAGQALIATPSLAVAAGGLESNLEERMPSHHNGNLAKILVEVNFQDDVEI